MSFSGTPLGQGRRLDRDTFLGKPTTKENRPTTSIPASFNFSANLGSPPKPSSPTREQFEPNEPALARFARQKQREADHASRPGAPKIAVVAPTPSKWSVKDTTVNVANAFAVEAARANGEMPVATHNPNSAWASGSRPQPHVPRSTSVEYEEQASRITGARRVPAPNRGPPRAGSSATLKPPSRNRSLQHVPDSEGEEAAAPSYVRAPSPYHAVIAAAKRALAPALTPATYYVKEPQRQDESMEQPTTNGSYGNDSTYDYEQENRDVEQAMAKSGSQRPKRGRISVDNQAYKPTELESSSDESDDGRPKKRKTKPAARVTTLPTVADGKTTRKRRTKSKGNIGGVEDETNEDISVSGDAHSRSASQRPSVPRYSVEAPNSSYDQTQQSYSMDITLPSISEEVTEEELPPAPQAASQPQAQQETEKVTRPRRNSRASTPLRTQRFSIGSALGRVVRSFGTVLYWIVGMVFAIGQWFKSALGTILETIFMRPVSWAKKTNPRLIASAVRYTIIALTVLSAWYLLRSPTFLSFVPRFSLPSFPSSSRPVYVDPSIPAKDLSEVVSRLSKIEYAISGLSVEGERVRARADQSLKGFTDLEHKFGQLETKLSSDARRNSDAESRARDVISKTVTALRQEIESLNAQIDSHQRTYEREKNKPGVGSDEEARAKLRALEDRLSGAESSVKEALELGKKLAASPAIGNAPAWWNKVATDVKGRLHVDGKDVLGLISQMVDSSVQRAMNDRLNRADFALHSGGARVIPSLTSSTFEIKPNSMAAQFLGIITGNGHAIGRPPVTALHHELQNGHCWPFTGTQGQLGVALARPAYIDEITIDHVAKDVAFDMRSAPRQMEVWGLIEGQDNKEKLDAWRQEKLQARKVAAEAAGEVVDAAWEMRQLEREKAMYPRNLPKTPEYIRIASFTYNIHSSQNIQTFPVDPEIKKLGIDFGILALRVLNNWGRDEYTCLYRFRVHGTPFGDIPQPFPDIQPGPQS